jgi:hypothetical protein
MLEALRTIVDFAVMKTITAARAAAAVRYGYVERG